jgi:hypothetical protein
MHCYTKVIWIILGWLFLSAALPTGCARSVPVTSPSMLETNIASLKCTKLYINCFLMGADLKGANLINVTL